MNDNKLTPRVGDRVLVDSPEALSDRFAIGTVLQPTEESGGWWVKIDRRLEMAFRIDELAVLDRDPVEWPEGWESFGALRVQDLQTGHTFTRRALERAVACGPEILAMWDELVGGDA